MTRRTVIDLNGDVGERDVPTDADWAFLGALTSCNVSCGLHAGSDAGIRETIARAVHLGLLIGAHPSYDDPASFGRNPVVMTSGALTDLVFAQVAAIKEITDRAGVALHHVKLHGALYNTAAIDGNVARAAVEGVRRVMHDPVIYAPPDSAMTDAASRAGIPVMIEAFADRGYDPHGRLLPRSVPGSMLDDPEAAAAQAIELACRHRVMTSSGSWYAIRADTICFHGDRPGAADRVTAARHRLTAAGIGLGA